MLRAEQLKKNEIDFFVLFKAVKQHDQPIPYTYINQANTFQ